MVIGGSSSLGVCSIRNRVPRIGSPLVHRPISSLGQMILFRDSQTFLTSTLNTPTITSLLKGESSSPGMNDTVPGPGSIQIGLSVIIATTLIT